MSYYRLLLRWLALAQPADDHRLDGVASVSFGHHRRNSPPGSLALVRRAAGQGSLQSRPLHASELGFEELDTLVWGPGSALDAGTLALVPTTCLSAVQLVAFARQLHHP